jgi:crotonobetainyl-CoA:carnitine CoA-transferase CaiB-like acyl-CoA transferase
MTSVSGDQPQGPLAGITVLDFTRIISGPFATQLLGDLGADVIKVEQPPRGDDARYYGQKVTKELGAGAVFLSLNRNKRSLGLDLKHPAASRVVRRLVRGSDVVIHNFRPAVADRLGIGFSSIRSINRRAVYCAISGYGHINALKDRVANDLAIQAFSGLMSITGEPERGPVRVPVSISDLVAGLYAALGVVGALLARERTREGQEVRLSLLGGVLSFLGHHLTDYLLTGDQPQRMGSANTLGQPNQAFATQDGWVIISVINDDMWRRCCIAIGAPELATDIRFDHLAARYQNRGELIQRVSECVGHFTTNECVSALDAAGVACSPIQSLREVAQWPYLRETNALTDVTYRGRSIPVVGSPLLLSCTPVNTRRGVPEFGEHTGEILEGVGYDPVAVERLRKTKVVA